MLPSVLLFVSGTLIVRIRGGAMSVKDQML